MDIDGFVFGPVTRFEIVGAPYLEHIEDDVHDNFTPCSGEPDAFSIEDVEIKIQWADDDTSLSPLGR